MSGTQTAVVVVDDEITRIAPWTRRLKAELAADARGPVPLLVFPGVRETVDFVEGPEGFETPVGLFILDSMLPAGGPFTDAQTGYGLRTGGMLRSWLRSRYPEVPALMLSQHQDPRSLLGELGPLDVVYRKRDLMPAQLAEEARRLLLFPGRTNSRPLPVSSLGDTHVMASFSWETVPRVLHR